MTVPEQFRPQFLREAFKQLTIHAETVIDCSETMIEDQDNPLDELQKTDLQTLKNSAQTLLGLASDRLSLDSEQLVSFAIDENLQSATNHRLSLPPLKSDLTACINSIIGLSRVLLKGKDGSLTGTQKKSLTQIQENGQKLSQILHQLFSSWNIEDLGDNMVLNSEEVNLKDVFDRFVSWVEKYGEAEIVNNGLDGLAPIWSDAIRLHGIIHFTTSALSERFRQGKIVFNANLNGGEISVSIQNKGFVFSESTIEEIEKVSSIDDLLSNMLPVFSLLPSFTEPFDLCISRLLVEILGGKMHLKEVDASSIVTFALPVAIAN